MSSTGYCCSTSETSTNCGGSASDICSNDATIDDDGGYILCPTNSECTASQTHTFSTLLESNVWRTDTISLTKVCVFKFSTSTVNINAYTFDILGRYNISAYIYTESAAGEYNYEGQIVGDNTKTVVVGDLDTYLVVIPIGINPYININVTGDYGTFSSSSDSGSSVDAGLVAGIVIGLIILIIIVIVIIVVSKYLKNKNKKKNNREDRYYDAEESSKSRANPNNATKFNNSSSMHHQPPPLYPEPSQDVIEPGVVNPPAYMKAKTESPQKGVTLQHPIDRLGNRQAVYKEGEPSQDSVLDNEKHIGFPKNNFGQVQHDPLDTE